jgi:hypothetical protein
MEHFITSTTIFGFGLDAYIIVLILGIPIFFFWRWTFKKFIIKKLKRRVITWLVTMVSAPVIYFLIIIIWIFAGSYYPDHDFNTSDWLTHKDKRYEYSKDLIKSKILIGKTKNEVRRQLGNDVNKVDNNIWYYDLGNEPGMFNPDQSVLEIDFKDNKVTNVFEHYNN